MFISEKEKKELKQEIEDLKKQVKSLKTAIEALKKTNKEQAALNKKYNESLGKKYLSDTFVSKSEEERNSIMDEWINGAKKEDKR